jgi:hypothetical protein
MLLALQMLGWQSVVLMASLLVSKSHHSMFGDTAQTPQHCSLRSSRCFDRTPQNQLHRRDMELATRMVLMLASSMEGVCHLVQGLDRESMVCWLVMRTERLTLLAQVLGVTMTAILSERRMASA